MELSEYAGKGPIFFDANIFIDFSLPNAKYIDTITVSVGGMELKDLNVVTIPLVLDEVSYILLMYKGAMLLGKNEKWRVIEELKRNRKYANATKK